MSLSLRMQERFERRSTTRLVVAVFYILSCLIYLAWRLTTFNQNALTLSSIYYIADIIAFILGLSTIYVSSQYRHRESPPAPAGLFVDVFHRRLSCSLPHRCLSDSVLYFMSVTKRYAHR